MLEETTTKNKVVKKTDKTTTPEVKKETKEVVEDKVEAVKVETKEIKSEEKMGVVRFLQLEPQEFYIEELLKSTHGNDIMTQSEWEKTLDDLLNKKITD